MFVDSFVFLLFNSESESVSNSGSSNDILSDDKGCIISPSVSGAATANSTMTVPVKIVMQPATEGSAGQTTYYFE